MRASAEAARIARRFAHAALAMDGVVEADLMSLSEVDNITQEGAGTLRFEWMMREPPETQAGADAIRDAVEDLPLLMDILTDCLYHPTCPDEYVERRYPPRAG
mgnify:CR=1 FL=1